MLQRLHNQIKILLLVIAVICLFFVVGKEAHAAPTRVIPYQGKLTNIDGTNVADGSYSFKILFYTDVSAGSCVYAISGSCGTPTSYSVTVANGIFYIEIGGTGTNSLTGISFDQDLWMSVTVGTDTMTPRKRLTGSVFNFDQTSLRLTNTAGTFYEGFTASNSLTSNVTWTLPAADGSPNQVLSTDGAGNLSWATATGGGGSSVWSALTAPTANLSLSMAAYTTTFTYGAATGAGVNLFNIADSASNTGTGSLLSIATATSSAASPLLVKAAGTNALYVSSSGNVGIGTTSPGTNKLDVAGGNLSVDLTGSTTSSPYTLGFINPTTGTAQRLQLDSTDALQSANGDKTQLFSYWGLVIQGHTESVTAPSFQTGITSDNDVTILGTKTGAVDLFVQAAVSQTADILDLESGGNSLLDSFNASGFLEIGSTTSTTAALQSDISVAAVGGGTVSANFFNNTLSGSLGSTETAYYGVNITPKYNFTGTVTSAAALYLGTPTVTSGTLTNKYGLYQNDSASRNYFAGNTSIGSTSATSQFNVGTTNQFQVTSAGNISTSGSFTLSTSGGTASFATGAGNTFIWKIPSNASATACASATAQGIIIQDSGGTQRGHVCISGATASPANALAYYANTFNTSATDVAENYSDISNTLTAGDIVSLDSNGNKQIIKTNGTADNNLLGVISENPGIMLTGISESDGGKSDLVNPKPVALQGRIKVKVTSQNGNIKVGDFITSSNIAGVGQKATSKGYVVGKALENFSDPDPTKIGEILLFANLIYYTPPDSIASISQIDKNSISSINMNLTSLAGSDLYVGNKKFTVDEFGNTNILANLNVTGNSNFVNLLAQKANINELKADTVTLTNINITNPIQGDPVKGFVQIPAGTTSFDLNNSNIKGNSFIFVTPYSNDEIFSYVLKDQSNGKVTIQIDRKLNQNVRLEYLITN